MTTRVRTDQKTLDFTWAATGNPEGPLNAGSASVDLSSTMKDEVTPGYFKKARRADYLPVNPMTSTKRTLEAMGNISMVRWWNSNNDSWHGQFSGNLAVMHGRQEGYFPPTSGFPSAPPWQPLLQKALADARTEGWDILTFLAEFRKTAAMVRTAEASSSHRAKLIYDRVLRYRRTSVPDLVRVFSEMWLEYRYGWRVMMYDLQDANEALRGLHTKGTKIIRRTSSDTAVINTTSEKNSSQLRTDSSSIGGLFRQAILIQDERSIKVRAGVAVELGLDGSPFMANPIVTAYELVPYSFVVDWFFNIGEAVSAWAPFARGQVKWSFVSTEKRGTRVLGARPVQQGAIVPSDTTACFTVGSVVDKTRVLQKPVFDLRFRVNLDKSKIADLAALFALGHARRMKGLMGRR